MAPPAMPIPIPAFAPVDKEDDEDSALTESVGVEAAAGVVVVAGAEAGAVLLEDVDDVVDEDKGVVATIPPYALRRVLRPPWQQLGSFVQQYQPPPQS